VRSVVPALALALAACGGRAPAPSPAPALRNATPRAPDDPIARAVAAACGQLGVAADRAVRPPTGGVITEITFGGFDVVTDAKVHLSIAPRAACDRLRATWTVDDDEPAQCDLHDGPYALQVFGDPVDPPPATVVLCNARDPARR
jgi:hypothetical protein